MQTVKNVRRRRFLSQLKHLWPNPPYGHLIWIVGLLLAGTLAAAQSRDDQNFNQPGNILITDQFNNRVIEIDRAGHIVWQFGNGPQDTTAASIVGTNDAERVGILP